MLGDLARQRSRPWLLMASLALLTVSLLVAAASTALVLALAAPAAFALSWLRFRGAGILGVLLLAGMMAPVQAALLPLIRLHGFLGTRDTLGALILTYAAFELPLAVLILRSFFAALPAELLDAARVDGCSSWGVFRHVALPLSRPALATAGILAALAAWNEFVLALALIDEPSRLTLPVGLSLLKSPEYADPGIVAAALVLAVLPPLLLYAFARRGIISALTAGAPSG